LGIQQINVPPYAINITREEMDQNATLKELFGKYGANRGTSVSMPYSFHDGVVLISRLQARSNITWGNNEMVWLCERIDDELYDYVQLSISRTVA
jgi:hypothetical protein